MFGKFGLPLKVKFCSNCTRSNQRPHNLGEFKQNIKMKKEVVDFDENGMCLACKYFYEKNSINWKQREKHLVQLCNKHRKNNGDYDILVPGSGGKDSFYVAHQLKTKYKMNPLLVTWKPALYTDIGKKNFDAWLQLGMANYTFFQNPVVHSKLTKLAFENLCHPFQPFILGQKNFAPKMSKLLNIKLIMYGESYVEFGMDKKNKDNPKMDPKYFSSNESYKKMFISGVKVTDIIKKHKLSLNDLDPYLPLSHDEIKKNKIEFHNFSYYKRWNFHENYYYAVENTNFKPSDERSEGSYDKYASMDDKLDWLHFYTFYTKFGMGRTTAATDQEIRSGVISREEGKMLVKRFDGEFPKKYLNDCLKYMNISEKKFTSIIDKFRPKHLWKKDSNKWILKNPIWK